MIDDLGESGRLALAFARLVALELGAPTVGTEHLFLGVAQLGDVTIRDRVAMVGVDLDRVCAEIRSEAGGSGEADGKLSFTAEAQLAVEAARHEAARFGDGLVEAPHILIGVLRDEDGLAAR